MSAVLKKSGKKMPKKIIEKEYLKVPKDPDNDNYTYHQTNFHKISIKRYLSQNNNKIRLVRSLCKGVQPKNKDI